MASRVDQVGEPICFSLGDRETPRREPVVAPAILVALAVQRDDQFLDQSVDQHALNRAIQRARAEASLAVGEALDVLHDAVAMRFAVGESEEDVKDGRRQQRQRLVVRWCRLFRRARRANILALRRGCNHGGYIYRGASWLSRQRAGAGYGQRTALSDDPARYDGDGHNQRIAAGSDDGDDVRSGGQREVLIVTTKLLDTADRCAVHVDLRAPRLNIELNTASWRVRTE